MEYKQENYEPVINFRKNRPQMQVKHAEREELYEMAFFSEEKISHSEYALNTTTWD